MRNIQTWRDPYDEGFSTCRLKEIELREGLTVLVGCNGAGKTTLLHNINTELKKNKIPCVAVFEDEMDMSNKIGELMYDTRSDYMNVVAESVTSSEGENISIRLKLLMSQLGQFIRTGEYDDGSLATRLLKGLKGEEKNLDQVTNERWILIDSVDSGYSIDNIIELKEVFNMIIDDGIAQNIHVYIIVSANEYELANNEQCFDVNAGKYIIFDDYKDYKQFIIASRQKKDRRNKKLAEKRA